MAVDTSREAVVAHVDALSSLSGTNYSVDEITFFCDCADIMDALLSERDAERAAKEKAIKERDKARAFALTPSRRKVRKPTMDVTA